MKRTDGLLRADVLLAERQGERASPIHTKAGKVPWPALGMPNEGISGFITVVLFLRVDFVIRKVSVLDVSLYCEVEKRTIKNYNLRCIDGSIHGCGKCVGYCCYDGHTGFLTAELQTEHQCIEKGCFYHHPKPVKQRRSHADNVSLQKEVLSIAQGATFAMEGLRIIRVAVPSSTSCVVYYAAIAMYDISVVAEKIAASTGCQVVMKQIPCDFDTAVALVMA